MSRQILTNAIGHTKTILKHKAYVARFCFESGLYLQGITHDLSKFSPVEFRAGMHHFQGVRSPNNAEREACGISPSWLHHKGRNRHHFEYWIDYDTTPGSVHHMAGCRMPRRYVAEMIFDRVSASMVYLGDRYHDGAPLEYFLNMKEIAWFIHPTTLRQMEFLLTMWKEKGEAYTTTYIRNVFLAKKKRGRTNATKKEH